MACPATSLDDCKKLGGRCRWFVGRCVEGPPVPPTPQPEEEEDETVVPLIICVSALAVLAIGLFVLYYCYEKNRRKQIDHSIKVKRDLIDAYRRRGDDIARKEEESPSGLGPDAPRLVPPRSVPRVSPDALASPLTPMLDESVGAETVVESIVPMYESVGSHNAGAAETAGQDSPTSAVAPGSFFEFRKSFRGAGRGYKTGQVFKAADDLNLIVPHADRSPAPPSWKDVLKRSAEQDADATMCSSGRGRGRNDTPMFPVPPAAPSRPQGRAAALPNADPAAPRPPQRFNVSTC